MVRVFSFLFIFETIDYNIRTMRVYILIPIIFFTSFLQCIAQEHQTFYVHPKALSQNEYNSNNIFKSPYIKLDQKETVKLFGDSIEPISIEGDEYVYRLIYRNGTQEVFDGYETKIEGYYSQIGIIVLSNANGNHFAINIENGEYLDRGDPQYDIFSPSKRYLITSLFSIDEMNYYLHEKIDGEYICKGRLIFHRNLVKDIYWENDDEIRLLGKKNEFWIPYSGKISTKKLEYYY